MVRTSTWCCRPGSSSSSQCVVISAGESWWAVRQCCRGTQHCTSDDGRAADEGARWQELQLDPCAEQDTRLQEQQGAAPTRVWADVGRRRGVMLRAIKGRQDRRCRTLLGRTRRLETAGGAGRVLERPTPARSGRALLGLLRVGWPSSCALAQLNVPGLSLRASGPDRGPGADRAAPRATHCPSRH